MANNANQKAEQKKKAPVTVENAVVASPAKASKPLLLWLAIVVLLIVSAALFWLIQQQKVEMETLTQRIGATEQFESKIAQVNQTISSNKASTTQLLENLNSTDVGLAEKIEQVIKIQDMTNDDVKRVWTMAEVEYLLQTANQRAQLAADSEGARQALLLADEKLKELADPRLYRLRAMLSDEQLALAAVHKVDVDGMAVRLQSAIDRVDNIQVLMAPEVKTEQEQTEPTESIIPADWQDALSMAWQEIRSLVVIRHQDDGAAAVLVPEERYFLYQNLHLKLEAARTALLEGREAIFHDSLTAAENWLQKYFVGDERDAVLASIKEINAEVITVELPDISASLAWLQQNGDQE